MSARDSIPTRSALLARVRNADDADGWADFCATYGGLIRRLAMKAGLSEPDAAEVTQDVFLELSRSLPHFEYDREKCSFKHWLSRVVKWRVIDRLRRRRVREPMASELRSAQGGPAEEEGVEAAVPAELEAIWVAEWNRQRIDQAAERVRQQVSLRQFQIFYLHVLNERPAAEVARRLRVSRGQVYLAKLRIGRIFRQVLKSMPEDEECS